MITNLKRLKSYRKMLVSLLLIAMMIMAVFIFTDFNAVKEENKIVIEHLSDIAPYGIDTDNESVAMPEEIGNAEAIVKLKDDDGFVEKLVADTKSSIDFDASAKEVDAAIARHRAAMKTHFSAQNNFVAEKLNLETVGNTAVSNYSPYISVNYDSKTITDSGYNKIKKISSSRYVDKIYLHNKVKPKEQGVIAESGKEVNIRDFVRPGTLTGDGINIGILETGIADKNNPNFSGNISVKKGFMDNVDDHATMVASVAAGKEGVARYANILSISSKDLVSSFNWLFDNSVDVLNCSFMRGSDKDNGKYTSTSAFFDFQVENNMLPIVAAAGNYEKSDYKSHFVPPPANAYNVLTVGASSGNDYVPSFSCWETNGLSKPNIVAPNFYKIPNTYSSEKGKGGTSFSAPMVTGIIALLMQYKPSIKACHDEISSILMTTATAMPHYLDAEASGLNSKAGAGIVNFERAKERIDQYSTVKTVTGDAPGGKASSPIILAANQTVQASVVTSSSGDYNGTGNIINYYNLYILDAVSNKIVAQSSGNGNVQFLRYKATKTSLYKIGVDLRSTAVKYDQGAMSYYVFK